MSSSSCWADLPEPLLEDVLNKLISIYDYLNFSVVCKPWRSIALQNKHHRRRITATSPQLPMLIVPEEDDDGDEEDGVEGKYGLYDVAKNRIRKFQMKGCFERFCGSSCGWLIMVEETMDITLLNPFSGVKICLPPLMEVVSDLEEDEFDYKCHVKKAILTSDPSLTPQDYVVAAIYGDFKKLALFRSSDRSWTYFQPDRVMFDDVIFHKGTIFALDRWMGLWKVEATSFNNGSIRSANFGLATPRLDRSSIDPVLYGCTSEMYVAESSRGELFLIRRFHAIDDEHLTRMGTTHFKVYKLVYIADDEEKSRPILKYLEMKTLENDVLFIGDNHSMSISSEDFSGCLSNCIYYTDDNIEYRISLECGYPDAGIFNVEDGSFHSHYRPHPYHKHLAPPIWIVPTLQ